MALCGGEEENVALLVALSVSGRGHCSGRTEAEWADSWTSSPSALLARDDRGRGLALLG